MKRFQHPLGHSVFALASIALFALTAPAHAAFTGSYDPSLWSTVNTNGGNGTAVANASTLQLTSSNFTNFDDAPLDASTLDYSVIATDAASITFHWAYATNDDNGSGNDTFGYAVRAAFVQLSVDGSYAAQSGTATVSVRPGDIFSFRMTSNDNLFGSAITTVTGFQALASVPEAPGGILALGAIPFAAQWIKRRRATRDTGSHPA